MKRSAFLINIARGEIVDETALIETLNSGDIAGAGLDVFCEEPLPSNNPLWTLPNVLITPHTSPQERDRDQRAVDLIRENIRRDTVFNSKLIFKFASKAVFDLRTP